MVEPGFERSHSDSRAQRFVCARVRTSVYLRERRGTHFSTRAPLLSQASSCAAAMLLGRWGPRATRSSGTDRAAVPRLGTPNLPLSLAAFPRPLPWQPL